MGVRLSFSFCNGPASDRHVASLSLLFVVGVCRYIMSSEEPVSLSNCAWFIGR
jgi:hypothetical protein